VLKIAYSKEAARTLKKMPRNVSMVILGKIEGYAADPAAFANVVKKLQGRDGYRMRVGDYRVIFNRGADSMIVEVVAPRGSAYD
jgi:mRNA interferase RelE/StbE